MYGGGTYANGTYYAINYEEQGVSIKLPSTLTLYDTKNAWAVKSTYQGVSAESLASDLTFDPVTGTIYGVFYDANYKECKRFCTLSLDDPVKGAYTSKLIAELPERMVGIAANQKGGHLRHWPEQQALHTEQADRCGYRNRLDGSK